MNMTNEEIVRDYNAAANKSKQVRILADLNCVTPGEIRAVLAEAGVEGVEAPKRGRARKPDPPEALPNPPERPPVSVYDRIETILRALQEGASRYVRDSANQLVVALFRGYIDQRLGGNDGTIDNQT